MCGIAGYFSVTNKFSSDDLKKMTDVLLHRGPDAGGFFVKENIGLGHRRLSIIDLSESANQPFLSADERYVIVYNGEVYNFKEIANELKQLNPQLNFKTTSDTEVIVEAFAQWGANCVSKLNGMFAFAIYDQQTKELFIARDRMGVKPIYYYSDNENFVFASELKSFKQLRSKLTLKIDYTAVNEFLHLGYIPQPHSIYENIYKFPSGSFCLVKNGKLSFTNYWNFSDKISSSIITDETHAKKELMHLVESSVKYRMISDVPFGTFLSGGIDSSVVTAAAQKFSEKPLTTFSIGFKDATHNESNYAKNVAAYLKTNHHEFTVTQKEAMGLVSELPLIYDEPYADSSAIPTLLVSKLARQHVTMTLSGDGGDEMFMGYGVHQWAKRLSNPLMRMFRKPISIALKQMPDRYKRVGELLNFANEQSLKSHIFSQEQYLFSQVEINALVNVEYFRKITLDENYVNLKRNLSAQEEQALFDLNYYLKDDLLVKVDRATMQHSLETRVPLLDYRIVEFALNLSPELKIKNGESKYLLKQVLYEYLPQSFFNRPKWGFSIPLSKWLRTDLKFLSDTYLSEKVVTKHGIVNLKQVELLKKRFYKNNEDYLYNRIWQLIVLHQWLENS